MQKQKGFILPIIMVVVVIVLLGVAGYFAYKQYSAPKPIACTMEAKLCPNGSAVGRTGPNCEFADCPAIADETAGWETYKNDTLNYEFKYPKDFVAQDVSKYQTDDYVFRACNSQNSICLYSNIIRHKAPSFNDFTKLLISQNITHNNNPDLKTLNSYIVEVAQKQSFVLETEVSYPDKKGEIIDSFIDFGQPVVIQTNVSGENVSIDDVREIYNKVISTFKFTK